MTVVPSGRPVTTSPRVVRAVSVMPGSDDRVVVEAADAGDKANDAIRVDGRDVAADVDRAVASLGGAPKHPVWYHNIAANPHVELRDGELVQDMVAREVFGGEKQIWWDRAVEAYPPYAEYQEKTDRQIPVFVLEATPGS